MTEDETISALRLLEDFRRHKRALPPSEGLIWREVEPEYKLDPDRLARPERREMHLQVEYDRRAPT